jgi:signal transduction histidine kinase
MTDWRARISPLDIGLAAAVVAAMEVEVFAEGLTPRGPAVAAFAVMGGVLVLRRAAPAATLAIGFAAYLGGTAAGVPLHTPVTPIFFIVLVMYAVGMREPLPRAIAALVCALAVIAAAMVVARGHGEPYDGTDIPWVALLCATPWFVGRAMRGRLDESALLQRRAQRLERERVEAVTGERARIARELHDVVAHSVSVMVVQAGAAERVLGRDPAAAVEPLRSIQETGRQALVEMSRLLGLLRDGGEELGLAPQPGIEQLDALLAQMRESGLPVSLEVDGERRPLPPGVDLSAYRVVQEALTNALKHAGDARARVLLRYRPDALEVEVTDDGAGGGNGHAGGHGLAGMRERVAVFGGQIHAGHLPGGGFEVAVRLPLEAPS